MIPPDLLQTALLAMGAGAILVLGLLALLLIASALDT